jgi:histidinol phosphatase-like PHP family hydrolase
MTITSDWHIHSRNSCDEAALVVSDLIAEAAAAGITDFGLTDHIHTPYNLQDLAASRAEFLASNPPPRFHFGVEVSCVSAWELAELAKGGHDRPVYGLRQGGPPGAEPAIGITEADLRTYGVEYVVGGTHWPLYVPFERQAIIRDYHRQNLFLACHPLVDIVAHPWWWMGHWKDATGRYPAEPWFDDFGAIPQSLHDEFAAALVENGKVFEVNISAILLNRQYPARFAGQYLDYVAGMRARGVRLCIASDCHGEHYRIDFARAVTMLQSIGLTDEELWRLPPRQGAHAELTESSPHRGQWRCP